MSDAPPLIRVENLTMAYGSHVVQRDLNFSIERGEIFIIMGGSGCGKSTLFRHMIGLLNPAEGDVYYDGTAYWQADRSARQQLRARWGVAFQSGGLFSDRTLAENVAIPLQQYTTLGAREIAELVDYKLALVGLSGYQPLYPGELSGGMQKRAGLARAMAMDPDILFFDEPSAGLDPVSSRLLDELLLQIRDTMNTTIVVVTHELASIFGIGDKAVFLDAETRTMLDCGPPTTLLKESPEPRVRHFLSRGATEESAA